MTLPKSMASRLSRARRRRSRILILRPLSWRECPRAPDGPVRKLAAEVAALHVVHAAERTSGRSRNAPSRMSRAERAGRRRPSTRPRRRLQARVVVSSRSGPPSQNRTPRKRSAFSEARLRRLESPTCSRVPADAYAVPTVDPDDRAADSDPAGLTYESEGPIGAPETSHAEDRSLRTVGERRHDGRAQHSMHL